MDVRCSVFIATSVDGFIARPDGDVDWLQRPEYELPGTEDYGYSEYIATVDAVVMGRHSYKKVLTFPDWAYGDLPVYVLASRDVHVPDELRSKVTVASGTPQDVVARLAAAGKRHAYIDGGVTIQRFLQARLIQEMTITRIPFLLGKGISLFGSAGPELQLRLVTATEYDNGPKSLEVEGSDTAEKVAGSSHVMTRPTLVQRPDAAIVAQLAGGSQYYGRILIPRLTFFSTHAS